MTFLEAVVATVLGFIFTEAPNVKRNPELASDFSLDIATTVGMHAEISDGRLVDAETDVLILSAVTYRETRFRLPPADGDCHSEHPYLRVPRLQWPDGYKPVWRMNCRAVGPQQINKGNTAHLPPWKEVQELFPSRDWATAEGRKKDKLTEKQLRDPETNIRLSYGVLAHWKTECAQKDGTPAPVGVWFTAYRYGRCPFHFKTDKYHIDGEAKERCQLITRMAAGTSDAGYSLPKGFRCTYGEAEERKPRASTAVRLSSSQ